MARPDLRASVAADVERTVTAQFPDVEVVSAQIVAGGVLRVLIDRPGGVDHDLCSRVTQVLRPYLDRYTLEVSSPGIPRPLLKPEHYERSVGREIAVKTSEPIEGRRTFTGTLREADAKRIVIEQDAVGVEIPLALVRKSHVVEEL
jgi:ribosome maturation factor RimP